jgi:hypothetical protein
MNDREFVREASPWGFAATAVAMLRIWFSRFNDGTDALQSAGYALLPCSLFRSSGSLPVAMRRIGSPEHRESRWCACYSRFFGRH